MQFHRTNEIIQKLDPNFKQNKYQNVSEFLKAIFEK